MLVFAAAPILIIIVYGYARDVRILPPAINVVRQRGKSGVGSPFAIRNRFKAAATYEQFLAALFSGSDHVVTGFGLEAIGDCIVHKFFNGGSDAITALVEVDSQLMIRKFAVGGAAGKLMQSLHLGYETLNRGLSCNLTDGFVRLSSARSHAYADLHGLLETEISARFGQDALREVYFHEIINYLRLTTYKIRQSPIRGLGFFACTNILLGRYVERWG